MSIHKMKTIREIYKILKIHFIIGLVRNNIMTLFLKQEKMQ